MSRNVGGVYSLPAGYEAVSGQTIESAKYNATVQDLEADANNARPVVAGGTGSATAAGARTNLGALAIANPDFTGTLSISGTGLIARSGDFTTLRDGGNGQAIISIGDQDNASTYYDNTAHTWRTRNAAGTLMSLSGSALAVSAPVNSATFRDASGVNYLSRATANLTSLTDGGNGQGAVNVGDQTSATNYYDNTSHVWRTRNAGTTRMTLSGTALVVNVPVHEDLFRDTAGVNYLSRATANLTTISDGGNGQGAISIGDQVSTINYYDNTSHVWRSRNAGTTRMTLSGTALTLAVPLHVDTYRDASAVVVVLRSAPYTSFFGGGNGQGSISIGDQTTGATFYDNTTHTWRTRNAAAALAALSASSFVPGVDATATLGSSGNRWTTVYATTGTINTSDENEKTSFRALTDAEVRVAKRIAALMGMFQWKDSIAGKGIDGARLHIGVTAQGVKAAFESEGLDPARYAVWCEDEIEPGVMRQGVRYDQLYAFVTAGALDQMRMLTEAIMGGQG